jgi:hypothetical protein
MMVLGSSQALVARRDTKVVHISEQASDTEAYANKGLKF